jgi:archaellum component FlaF (FlaF/FlaG flagellin family)
MAGISRQRGMSIWVLMYIAATLVGVGAIGMQAFPSYVEFQAAKKALAKAKERTTVVEVRNAFDRAAEVDNITSVTGKDLEVTKQGENVVVSFAYQKEFHMFGPAWFTLKYAANSNEK